MSTTNEDVAAYVDGRLDGPYVTQTAEVIADALRSGQPMEACWQPGDGTRYDLVVVPVQALEVAAPPRVTAELGEWDRRCSLGIPRQPGSAVVVWLNHGAVAFDLSGSTWYEAGYVAQYFDTVIASGAALAILFNKTGEAFQR